MLGEGKMIVGVEWEEIEIEREMLAAAGVSGWELEEEKAEEAAAEQ
jgi:hypothetical protein